MKENKKALLKHFSGVLKKRVTEEKNSKNEINPAILKYVHRKDLIAIITQKNQGKIPPKLDLSILEKKELLPYIEDDLFIIAYVVGQWCAEFSEEEAVVEPPKTVATTAKSGKIEANQKKKS